MSLSECAVEQIGAAPALPAAAVRARKPALDSLTGIRFFAALHVVFYHFAPKTAGFESFPEPLQRFILAGPSSVGLFFVLSGFIMSYNYAGRPVKKAQFWSARFARIYPLYLLGFVLFSPFAWLKYRSSPPHLIVAAALALLLLQAWTTMATNWNAPGWSLSAEAMFYLLFPLAIPPIARLSRRAILWCAVILAAGCLVAPIAYTAGYIPYDVWHGWLMYNPLLWLPAFLIGILAERSGIRIGNRAGWAAALFIVVLCAICPRPDQELLSHGALYLPFAILICSLGASNGILSAPALVLLGEASYALYILHMPLWNTLVGSYTWMTTGRQTNEASHMAIFVVYVAICVCISIVCFKKIEQPSREWLKARLSRPVVTARKAAPDRLRNSALNAHRQIQGDLRLR